jgi:hypothetical protein
MVSATAICVPTASIVTRAPASSSRSSRSAIAVISFDLSATACWPSTSRCELAQAESRCSGSRPFAPAWLRREVLPSMAIISGPARSGQRARSPAAQLVKQSLNSAGSSMATTSPSVSWLGTP